MGYLFRFCRDHRLDAERRGAEELRVKALG